MILFRSASRTTIGVSSRERLTTRKRGVPPRTILSKQAFCVSSKASAHTCRHRVTERDCKPVLAATASSLAVKAATTIAVESMSLSWR